MNFVVRPRCLSILSILFIGLKAEVVPCYFKTFVLMIPLFCFIIFTSILFNGKGTSTYFVKTVNVQSCQKNVVVYSLFCPEDPVIICFHIHFFTSRLIDYWHFEDRQLEMDAFCTSLWIISFFLACRHGRFIQIKTLMILLQHIIFRQEFLSWLLNILFYRKCLKQVVLLTALESFGPNRLMSHIF